MPTTITVTKLRRQDKSEAPVLFKPHHFVVKYYNSVSTRVLYMAENSEPIVYLRSIWWYHNKIKTPRYCSWSWDSKIVRLLCSLTNKHQWKWTSSPVYIKVSENNSNWEFLWSKSLGKLFLKVKLDSWPFKINGTPLIWYYPVIYLSHFCNIVLNNKRFHTSHRYWISKASNHIFFLIDI